MADITEQILIEILKECENMLWKLAHDTNIPGCDADDLMQEMRIKIWETIKDNKYDPKRVKPTSFYYRVCKRHLRDVYRARVYRYSSGNRQYRDLLDQKGLISDTLLHNDGGLQENFTQSFSKDFIKCVLPSEDAKKVIKELYEEG